MRDLFFQFCIVLTLVISFIALANCNTHILEIKYHPTFEVIPHERVEFTKV